MTRLGDADCRETLHAVDYRQRRSPGSPAGNRDRRQRLRSVLQGRPPKRRGGRLPYDLALDQQYALFASQEAEEVRREHRKEDERLLGGHRQTGDLLVGEGGQAP
jgi:hypothetical protein